MGGPRRPDDDHGRYRQPSTARSAGRSPRDAAYPPRLARTSGSTGDASARRRHPRQGTGRGAAASANPFARLAAAWRRFRERPDSPQIIAGTLLAVGLLCAALGLLMHPSTAAGSYALPQSVSGGVVGTASATSATNGTPGSILAATATPPSAPTATSTTTPGAATATTTPKAGATATATVTDTPIPITPTPTKNPGGH